MERRSPNGKGLDLHFYPTSRRILAIMYLLQQLLLGSKDTVWVGTKVSIDPLILVACWEQLLGDSTIWSLWKLFFKEKFTKNSYYPIFKSQPGSVLWKSTEIRGKLGAVPWWQHHLDSQEKVFWNRDIIWFESDSLDLFQGSPQPSGVSRWQCLGDSIIWNHRKLFCRKVYWNEVILRFESYSLDLSSGARPPGINGWCCVYLTNAMPSPHHICQHNEFPVSVRCLKLKIRQRML